jgi:hypothetical protein
LNVIVAVDRRQPRVSSQLYGERQDRSASVAVADNSSTAVENVRCEFWHSEMQIQRGKTNVSEREMQNVGNGDRLRNNNQQQNRPPPRQHNNSVTSVTSVRSDKWGLRVVHIVCDLAINSKRQWLPVVAFSLDGNVGHCAHIVVLLLCCKRNMSGDDRALWEVHDIATEFDVLGHLGSGAFATVLLARHIATRQVCAIKKRRKKRESDNRVLSECYWLRHFRNPFVVQL